MKMALMRLVSIMAVCVAVASCTTPADYYTKVNDMVQTLVTESAVYSDMIETGNMGAIDSMYSHMRDARSVFELVGDYNGDSTLITPVLGYIDFCTDTLGASLLPALHTFSMHSDSPEKMAELEAMRQGLQVMMQRHINAIIKSHIDFQKSYELLPGGF